MKRIVYYLLPLCFGIVEGQAQIVDSSYHNYLYDTRTLYFSQLPIKKNTIIFWGDSITNWGDWAELTNNANALNRGIAGDNTYGLLNRIDEIIKYQPSKVFIMIGTNDLNEKIPLKNIISNYSRIVDKIKLACPHTKIYMQSVLPINNKLISRKYYTGTNTAIQTINHSLDSLARITEVQFINLYPLFLDEQNQMKANYTYDGLHLSGLGYLNWINILKKDNLL